MGTVARTNMPRMGVSEKPLIAQVQLAIRPGVNVLSMTSSHMNSKNTLCYLLVMRKRNYLTLKEEGRG